MALLHLSCCWCVVSSPKSWATRAKHFIAVLKHDPSFPSATQLCRPFIHPIISGNVFAKEARTFPFWRVDRATISDTILLFFFRHSKWPLRSWSQKLMMNRRCLCHSWFALCSCRQYQIEIYVKIWQKTLWEIYMLFPESCKTHAPVRNALKCLSCDTLLFIHNGV